MAGGRLVAKEYMTSSLSERADPFALLEMSGAEEAGRRALLAYPPYRYRSRLSQARVFVARVRVSHPPRESVSVVDSPFAVADYLTSRASVF